MVGTSDAIGLAAAAYLREHGRRAPFRVDDDISSAVGRHSWDLAHQLNRVKLRIMRLEMAGYRDTKGD